MQKQMTPERVFISYSHDNERHKQRVLDLANRLREDGVDANLDQYEESPEQGWARWMEHEINQADFVLIVGSKVYFDRLLGHEADGVGLGAKWEGAVLYQHLYESDMKTKGFVPVVFEAEDTKFIPTPLRQFTRYHVDTEEGYEKLYRRITNQPKSKRPTLGKRRELSKPKVATSTMYVGGPINPDLWDQAQWQGTFFIAGENPADGTIPSLGVGFKNRNAASKIFSDWLDRYGEDDLDEELRVSIVDGSVQGEDAGYTVHIGSEWLTNYKKLSKKSVMDEDDTMLSISRLNRMVPLKGSINLDRFKSAVRKSKIFYIMPGILDDTRSSVEPMPELKIRKSTIHFRHVDEIVRGDPDTPVLRTGSVDRDSVS